MNRAVSCVVAAWPGDGSDSISETVPDDCIGLLSSIIGTEIWVVGRKPMHGLLSLWATSYLVPHAPFLYSVTESPQKPQG